MRYSLRSAGQVGRLKVGRRVLLRLRIVDFQKCVKWIRTPRFQHQAHELAICHFATVCSSWVLINRSTSRRSITNVLGGPRPRPYVRLANRMVSRACLVMLIADSEPERCPYTMCRAAWVVQDQGRALYTDTLPGPRPGNIYTECPALIRSNTLQAAPHIVYGYTSGSEVCLNLDVILEQPGSSLMCKHPRVEQIVSLSAGFPRAFRMISTYMGSFGAPTPKLTMLLGSPTWLEKLKRTFIFRKGTKNKHDIVTRHIDKHGQAVFRGSKVGPGPHPPGESGPTSVMVEVSGIPGWLRW
jgi:hypothetical protein